MSILNAVLTPNFESSYYLVILSLAMFVALAYISSILIKRSKFVGKGRNIHVIERFYIASDKMLMIVKVGEIHYLMSSDKNGMNIVDKLENFTPNETEQIQTKFSDILDKVKINKD
jgi:flagellar biogenesis protein FliO